MINIDSGEGEGTMQIISVLGEKEIGDLKLLGMKIEDDMHCSVSITRAMSKKLASDTLICAITYELHLENIQV